MAWFGLGVEVRPVSSQEAEQYNLASPQGVAITRVDPDGALGKAGFEVQDILLALDGQPIEGVDSLTELVTALKPAFHASFSQAATRMSCRS